MSSKSNLGLKSFQKQKAKKSEYAQKREGEKCPMGNLDESVFKWLKRAENQP